MTELQWIRIALVMAAACSGAAYSAEPADWFLASQQGPDGARHFTVGLDSTVAYDGSSSGFLRSNSSGLSQSGSLVQAALAKGFEGHNVSFRAYLRSQDVVGIAGLWFRAEDANGGVVAFRNVNSPRKPEEKHSSVNGTAGWTPAELNIDVPSCAVFLFYGVQLIGSGEVWIDSVSLDARGPANVSGGSSAAVIFNPVPDRSKMKGPSNLDFEQERSKIPAVVNMTCKPSLSSQEQLPPKEWNECVGTHTYENANVYHGEFRHGDRDGFGVLEIEFKGHSSDNWIGWDEPAVYVGSFRAGRLNGHGVLIGKSGAAYTGTFKDNIAQSDLTQKGCSGGLSAGWTHCVGLYRYPNGNVYLGEFADGLPGGIGMLQVRDPVPSLYVGEFDGGKPSGRGAVSMHDGVY